MYISYAFYFYLKATHQKTILNTITMSPTFLLTLRNSYYSIAVMVTQLQSEDYWICFLVKRIFFLAKRIFFLIKRIFFWVKRISFLVKRISFLVKRIFFLVKRIFFLVKRIFFLEEKKYRFSLLQINTYSFQLKSKATMQF